MYRVHINHHIHGKFNDLMDYGMLAMQQFKNTAHLGIFLVHLTQLHVVHLTWLHTSEGRDPPSDVALVCSVRSYLLSINCDHPQSSTVCKLTLVALICQQWGQSQGDCYIQLYRTHST